MAKVSIYTPNELWDAVSYGQTNPQFTNENGEYYFQVPKGSYYLLIEKNGFKKQITVTKPLNGPVAEKFYTQASVFYKYSEGIIDQCLVPSSILKDIFNLDNIIRCLVKPIIKIFIK